MKKVEQDYVDESRSILARKLSDEAPEMLNQAREIDGRIGYLYFILAECNAELDRQSDAAAEVLKAQGLAAFVLKVKVEAMASGYRKDRDIVQGLIKASEGRIMLCQSILRFIKNLPIE